MGRMEVRGQTCSDGREVAWVEQENGVRKGSKFSEGWFESDWNGMGRSIVIGARVASLVEGDRTNMCMCYRIYVSRGV